MGQVGVSEKSRVLVVRVSVIRALLFGVHIRCSPIFESSQVAIQEEAYLQ